MKWLILLLIFVFSAISVLAKTEAEYQKEIAELETKIATLQNQTQTLANQIIYYDSQISLTELKITQTQEQIVNLTDKIGVLENSLQQKTKILENQIVQTYKQGGIDPFGLMFDSDNFSQAISRIKYLQLVQAQNRKFLHDTQLVQTSYAQQKNLVEDSQKKLQAQKTNLAALRIERNNLLAQTKNNEANYQKLLAQAKSELLSLKSFAKFKGGGILPPQPSPDGWYFNQRDERWGRDCIAGTCITRDPSYVWEVGCALTSVAMIHKKYGQDVSPLTFARNANLFFSNTAYILIPWPSPAGYKYALSYGNRQDIIDSELKAGRPVIVHLQVNTSDGHFVVLKSGGNGDYIMNDPWEGPDLKFSSYYNSNKIVAVITYTPS